MNQEQRNMIIDLAKSMTEDVYQKCLGEIRKMNAKWAEYLDERKEQFVTASFLQRGYRRYGKVTSNGVENINAVLGDARGLPIVYLIEAIIQYQIDKFTERQVIANAWVQDGKPLTGYALCKNV